MLSDKASATALPQRCQRFTTEGGTASYGYVLEARTAAPRRAAFPVLEQEATAAGGSELRRDMYLAGRLAFLDM